MEWSNLRITLYGSNQQHILSDCQLESYLLQVIVSPFHQSFRKKVRRLLALGLVQNYEKGEMAAELMDRGYGENEAVGAVEDADDLYDAERRLRWDCEICSSPINPDNVSYNENKL